MSAKCLDQQGRWRNKVVVTGNPRVYKALNNELAKVLNELKSLKKGENVSEDLLEVIQLITVTMDGMKDE